MPVNMMDMFNEKEREQMTNQNNQPWWSYFADCYEDVISDELVQRSGPQFVQSSSDKNVSICFETFGPVGPDIPLVVFTPGGQRGRFRAAMAKNLVHAFNTSSMVTCKQQLSGVVWVYW